MKKSKPLPDRDLRIALADPHVREYLFDRMPYELAEEVRFDLVQDFIYDLLEEYRKGKVSPTWYKKGWGYLSKCVKSFTSDIYHDYRKATTEVGYAYKDERQGIKPVCDVLPADIDTDDADITEEDVLYAQFNRQVMQAQITVQANKLRRISTAQRWLTSLHGPEFERALTRIVKGKPDPEAAFHMCLMRLRDVTPDLLYDNIVPLVDVVFVNHLRKQQDRVRWQAFVCEWRKQQSSYSALQRTFKDTAYTCSDKTIAKAIKRWNATLAERCDAWALQLKQMTIQQRMEWVNTATQTLVLLRENDVEREIEKTVATAQCYNFGDASKQVLKRTVELMDRGMDFGMASERANHECERAVMRIHRKAKAERVTAHRKRKESASSYTPRKLTDILPVKKLSQKELERHIPSDGLIL